MCDLLVDDNMLINMKDNVDEENLIVEFKIKLPMLPFEVVHLLAGRYVIYLVWFFGGKREREEGGLHMKFI